KDRLYRTAVRTADKLSHHIDKEYDVEIHIKEMPRHKYDVRARINYTGGTVSGRVIDWDPVTGVKESIESIGKQLA
ncbi:MAG: hypothetical protein ACQEP1_06240, partial [Nanobdellota archaeon]